MTKDEALKLALSALDEVRQETFRLMRDGQTLYAEKKVWEAIYTIKKVLAQPEQDNTYAYASSLAKTIWQKHYIKESPKFALLDTTEGVLTQIDNMTCGLVREKPAQPQQEPVAWGVFEGNLHDMFFTEAEAVEMAQLKGNHAEVKPLYTAPQRTWVGLTAKEKHEFRYSHMTTADFIEEIEAKLRSKNNV